MSVRAAAIAGQFYPADAGELRAAVEGYLSAADAGDGAVPKAIIAPHAGFVYSGAVAASAYARLAPAADRIKRVVLLGPSHRVALKGIALSGADFFETPLGRIRLDKQAAADLKGLGQVGVSDPAHAQEHSLEVHLPFLQVLLNDFTLVPLVVGQAPPEQVAEVMRRLWGGPETLIVVSSDLSHYLDYHEAQIIDNRTRDAIENLAPQDIEKGGACGRYPVGGLLRIAANAGMRVETVDLRNSGDTAGGKDRVVGYGSWLFFDQDFEARTRALLDKHGARLLKIAGATITLRCQNPDNKKIRIANLPNALKANGASFVTLKTAQGQLRGCSGSDQAHRPLAMDVANSALKAAFNDPRFKPVTEAERESLQLSISVLSPKAEMTVQSEGDLLAQLRPGQDGLVIQDGTMRALFLPAVWEQMAEPAVFLAHLKKKAGMAPGHWSPNFKAWRFIAEEAFARDLDDPGSVWR
ncbi:MAG: AmmeMemoRadiSam system protein B [Sphingomonadales bacterium]